MLEFEQLKLRLEGNEAELRDLKDAIGYDRLKKEIDELELKAAAPGFWDDTENSQKILQKTVVRKWKPCFMHLIQRIPFLKQKQRSICQSLRTIILEKSSMKARNRQSRNLTALRACSF